MQVIVSDTSCLIDLRVGNILAPFFSLPYRFVIPEELFESEFLSFSLDEKALSRLTDALPALIAAGVKYPAARGTILVAVAGYDESQLEQYAEQISRLVRDGVDAVPTVAETEAHDRLVGLLEGVSE